MVDFAKLTERLRTRVHKVHVLYRCSVCGKEQWYVTMINESIVNSDKHWVDGSRCRGRFRLVKRRTVLKVWCDTGMKL